MTGIKLPANAVEFIHILQDCHINEDFVWYVSIKDNPIIWLHGNTHYYCCMNIKSKCTSMITFQTDDTGTIIHSFLSIWQGTRVKHY